MDADVLVYRLYGLICIGRGDRVWPHLMAIHGLYPDYQIVHELMRVTAPREPCFKFNAIMGYPQAARDMVLSGRSGFYLAVDVPGTIEAGQAFTLVPGRRALGIPQALAAKRIKHLR